MPRAIATHGAPLPSPAAVQQHPVIDPVLGLAGVLEHLGEEFSKEVVVRCFLEAELPDVVEVDAELLCVPQGVGISD